MTRQGRWCCVHTPAPLVVQRIAINGDWQYWLEGRKKITISTGRRTPTGFHATDQGQSNLLTCQETRIKYFTRKKKTARLIYKSPETIHWFMIPCREKPNNGAMRVPPRTETQHTQFKNKRWRYFLGSRRSAHPAKRRRRQTNTTTTCMIPGIVAHHFAIAGFPSGVALATSPIQMVQTKREKRG